MLLQRAGSSQLACMETKYEMQEQEEAKLCVFPQTTYRRVTIRPAFPLVGCEVIFDQVTKRSVQVKPWRTEKNKKQKQKQIYAH